MLSNEYTDGTGTFHGMEMIAIVISSRKVYRDKT
jgi:hypothetical protein